MAIHRFGAQRRSEDNLESQVAVVARFGKRKLRDGTRHRHQNNGD
jgi:hypothetical protein